MILLDTFFFICITTLFSILNPLGALAPFLAMTANDNKEKRLQTANMASLVSFFVLIVVAFAGTFIFKVSGISLPALKIAGGALLFLVALDMLNARPPRSKSTKEESLESLEKKDVAIFPLAIPVISGPGAIASVLILSERAGSFWQHTYLYLAIALCVFGVFVALRFAHQIAHWLGQIGINVLSRLMGLVLAAIAIQFILDGLLQALPGLGA